MIRRIQLQNFMSHKDSVIELGDTLTVLVGPNNCGKSAVVAALQALCRNERGSKFVLRHGQREAIVQLELDDQHRVAWHRTKAAVSYLVDGKETTRGVMPEGLQENILLMPLVQTKDGTDVDVHFGEQKEPIFLLNRKGQHAAEFFASSSDVEYLIRMQQLHRSRTREAKSMERRVAEELGAIDKDLAALAPAIALNDTIDVLETQHRKLIEADEEIGALGLQLSTLAMALAAFALRETSFQPYRSLREPPILADTDQLQNSLDAVRQSASRWNNQLAMRQALSVTPNPPQLQDVGQLTITRDKLCQAERDFERASHLSSAALLLQPLPQFRDSESLAQILSELRLALSTTNQLCGVELALRIVPNPPELVEINTLASQIQDIKTARQMNASATALHSTLVSLDVPPKFQELRELEDIVASIHRASQSDAKTRDAQILLAGLQQPPQMLDTQALQKVLIELENAFIEKENAGRVVARFDVEMSGLGRQLTEAVEKNPMCPTCGQRIDPGKLTLMMGATNA